jgi:antitoxin component of MazEF toxin-antitoxin module
MAAEPSTVTFDTTVAVTGNNTGIVVPQEAIEQLAAGNRPPVLVNVNGYEYRNTVGVMGGTHMVSISAAVRKATGLQGGDPIHVTLTVSDTPQEVTIPADFAAALAADEQASAFFGKLSNSMQRYHVDNITASTKPSAYSAPASKGDDARFSAESDASRLCRPRADRLVRSPWMRSSRRSACRP